MLGSHRHPLSLSQGIRERIRLSFSPYLAPQIHPQFLIRLSQIPSEFPIWNKNSLICHRDHIYMLFMSHWTHTDTFSILNSAHTETLLISHCIGSHRYPLNLPMSYVNTVLVFTGSTQISYWTLTGLSQIPSGTFL